MTMLYNSYPYWRYTPSKNGEREGLFVGDPLPLMIAHGPQYHTCKENNKPCAFVIEELTESDLPGPSLEDDLPVFEMLHKRLQDNNIDQNDIISILDNYNCNNIFFDDINSKYQKETLSRFLMFDCDNLNNGLKAKDDILDILIL